MLLAARSKNNPLPEPCLTADLLMAHSRKIAALVVMHYGGSSAWDADVSAACDRLGIPIIEDAAHATGVRMNDGRMLGSLGWAGCFSFFSNKNLSTGEGGMVATNDRELAERLRLMRSHGVTRSTWSRHQSKFEDYDVVARGHNFRCSEITAALGIVQLEKLDGGNDLRRMLFQKYQDNLRDCKFAQVFRGRNITDENGSCHILSLVLENMILRDAIRARLFGHKIQTSHHYRPISSFTAYSDHVTDPITDEFSNCQITLPLYPTMPAGAVDEICSHILAMGAH
jgi:dTDP-4-amino-4,6-dideoxygalactose transaminase